MLSIKVLNPHGLRLSEVWPTLRAMNLRFEACEALLQGRALKLSVFKAGVLTRMFDDMGRPIERRVVC